MDEPLLSIQDLKVDFSTNRGLVRAIRGVSFAIRKGETLALVGESGCGKSVTAHSITRLIPTPPGRITGGKILFEGVDLLQIPEPKLRDLRGSRISMIFQEPMTSLNTVFPIGSQIMDVLLTHTKMKKVDARAKALSLLELVKIPAPERRFKSYPHQLSGGMRQRVMIALALASPNPGLMIADEPTTALDVTIQAQILALLEDLKEKIGMALLLITHDMGVVAEVADRVAVMYAGRVVEEGEVFRIFENPSHPYTRGLLESLPSNPLYKETKRLKAIPGSVPDMITLGEGCPFANRCPLVRPECTLAFPEPTTLDTDHKVWCYAIEEEPVL